MLTFIALLPILALLFFMVVLEKPAYIAAPISLGITIIASLWFWQMDRAWLGASLIKGGLISLEITLIIIGVFLLIFVLKKGRAFSLIKHLISAMSRDIRIQAILLSWFLVAFIEGAAGFGTPQMVAAPLMVALGFSPLVAVVTTVVADVVPVTFGAVGVPITIGIAQGVSAEQILKLGPNFVTQTYLLTSLFHLILGAFVPLIILCLINIVYEKSIRKALVVWKLAIVAGLLFVVPSFIIAYTLGPEFPSIAGSLIGAAIFIFLIRKKIFLPKEEWVFKNQQDVSEDEHYFAKKWRAYVRAVTPYIVVIVLLIISRTNIWGVGDALRYIKISVKDILGTQIQYEFFPLYSPGFFFLVAAIIGFMLYRLSHKSLVDIAEGVTLKVIKTCIALVSVLGIVQIIIYSHYNALGYPSFSFQLVSLLTKTGVWWPIFSPFVGLFGAFIAGSSTVSNLMFSSLQVEAALAVGMSPIIGLGLQAIGSAAGNMIAVHNIIAAATVVHMTHAEGKVIKYNLIPSLSYALLAGVLGLLIVLF